MKHMHLCEEILKILHEKKKRIHAFEMSKSIVKAAKHARSYVFQDDYDEVNDKHRKFHFSLWKT